MRGTPVFLASLSRRSRFGSKTLATSVWSERTRAESLALLRRLVGPAGNPDRERVFRMNITMCLHRALTDEEVDGLPRSFREAEPIDLAGGPVEVLWENEVGLPTTQPCHDPRRHHLDATDPLLWFPLDCQRCPPCLARAAMAERRDRATGSAPRYVDALLRAAGRP